MTKPTARTVVESIQVSSVVDAHVIQYERLEQAFDALKWFIARNPEAGIPLDDYHWLYKQKGDTLLNIPSLVVIYTFDADYVELIHILIRLPGL